jgi:hypothetical protein
VRSSPLEVYEAAWCSADIVLCRDAAHAEHHNGLPGHFFACITDSLGILSERRRNCWMLELSTSVHPDLAAALRDCRRAFGGVALFSGVVNLLMLVPTSLISIDTSMGGCASRRC